MSQYFLRRTRRMAVNESSAGSIEPIVTSWANQVVTNGGVLPSYNTQYAFTQFINDISAAGIYQKMMSVNCYAPDNLTAAITPLICMFQGTLVPAYTPWTNTNFVAADLSVNGLKGNGSTKHLDTGIQLSQIFTGAGSCACGLTAYCSESVSAATSLEIGTLGSNNSNFNTHIAVNLNGGTYGAIGGFTPYAAAYPNTGSGYYSVNRSTATNIVLYRASSTISHFQAASNATNANTCNPGTCRVHAAWDADTSAVSYYSARTISFAAIHTYLTLAQSNNFYNAIQKMRQTLGGGFI